MLILFIELLSVFLCVFRVYGQKPKVDVKGIIAFGMMFAVLYLVNYLSLSRNYTYFAYIVLLLYCLSMFRERFVKTIVSMILSIIAVAVVQFGVMIILSFFAMDNYNIRDVVGNVLTLAIIWLILPRCKIDRLRDAVCKKHWLMYVIFVFATFTILLAIITGKMSNELSMGLFLFGIPAIAIIVFLVIYWELSVLKTEKMKKELDVMNAAQQSYDELIERVRLNQHGFNNQISAVLSTHHTCKTYEELVEKQQEYCSEIYEANRYNNILLIQNNFIAGFLYDKILEIEKNNIPYEYKIETKVEECNIPYFYLIEILGILIDNAIDATKENVEENEVFIGIQKEATRYKFIIRNTYREVNYDEIIRWFEMGKTTKNNGQGIGLYRVKKICNKWNCNIKCINKKYDNRNWIVFELAVDKKEDVV